MLKFKITPNRFFGLCYIIGTILAFVYLAIFQFPFYVSIVAQLGSYLIGHIGSEHLRWEMKKKEL